LTPAAIAGGRSQNSGLYKFDRKVELPGPATAVGALWGSAGSMTGLAFTKDGRFYAMFSNGNNLPK
jgi:hypothetical protein